MTNSNRIIAQCIEFIMEENISNVIDKVKVIDYQKFSIVIPNVGVAVVKATPTLITVKPANCPYGVTLAKKDGAWRIPYIDKGSGNYIPLHKIYKNFISNVRKVSEIVFI